MTDPNSNESYLLQNEKVIWKGNPKPRLLNSKAEFILIPMMTIFGSTFLLFEVLALSSYFGLANISSNESDLVNILVGIPPAFIGLYLIIGRLFYNQLKLKNSTYIITNLRFIEINSFLRYRLRSIDRNRKINIEIIPSKENLKNIVFGENPPWYMLIANTGLEFAYFSTYEKPEIIFFNLENQNNIEELLSKNDL